MSGMSFKSDDPNWDNSWNLSDPPKPELKQYYRIAEASSKEDLESQVNILIAEGYECQGGISTSSGYWFSQAMIKK